MDLPGPPYSATHDGWGSVAAEISVTDHDGVPVDGLTKPMWGVHLSTGEGSETKAVEPAHDDWTVEELSESAGFYSVVVKPCRQQSSVVKPSVGREALRPRSPSASIAPCQ